MCFGHGRAAAPRQSWKPQPATKVNRGAKAWPRRRRMTPGPWVWSPWGANWRAVSLRLDPGASFTDGGPGGEPGVQTRAVSAWRRHRAHRPSAAV